MTIFKQICFNLSEKEIIIFEIHSVYLSAISKVNYTQLKDLSKLSFFLSFFPLFFFSFFFIKVTTQLATLVYVGNATFSRGSRGVVAWLKRFRGWFPRAKARRCISCHVGHVNPIFSLAVYLFPLSFCRLSSSSSSSSFFFFSSV